VERNFRRLSEKATGKRNKMWDGRMMSASKK
jgi:hypothetical protein